MISPIGSRTGEARAFPHHQRPELEKLIAIDPTSPAALIAGFVYSAAV
jgi:hypothetical protein